MLDLKDDNHPAKRGSSARLLTRLEKEQAIVVLVVFAVWLPVYLIWVRGGFNRVVFQYIDSYPAMLHLVPLLALPIGIAIAYGKLCEAWGRHS
jgi:hypothetical protein